MASQDLTQAIYPDDLTSPRIIASAIFWTIISRCVILKGKACLVLFVCLQRE